MKYQALFNQKNNEKIFKAVVCCSRDWRFRVNMCYNCDVKSAPRVVLSGPALFSYQPQGLVTSFLRGKISYPVLKYIRAPLGKYDQS